MTKTEQIREEWLKSPEAKFYSPRGNKVIFDWWIQKLGVLLEEQKQEMVEIVEKGLVDLTKIPPLTEWQKGYNEAIADVKDTVLEIIKSK